jgi:hypothetical protein
MALVLADRVLETTTSTGSGTITLAGAKQGYQTFSLAIGDGNQTYYTIASQTEWEVGVGTYTSSGDTLSRDTVLSSSSGGGKVTFSVGTKDVFVTYPSEKSVIGNVFQNETSFTVPYLIESGKNGLSVGPITVTAGNSVVISAGQRWVVL